MPVNIEIKAVLREPEQVHARSTAIADSGPVRLLQTDTFFRVPEGRLKLREFRSGERPAELIFYRRADQEGPKASSYAIHRTDDPAGLRELLAASLGEIGQVIKERTLFLAGRTRIHLDQVENLGSYLELEVVLVDGDPHEEGEAEAKHLMQQLGITTSDLIDRAYIDLLTDGAENSR